MKKNVLIVFSVAIVSFLSSCGSVKPAFQPKLQKDAAPGTTGNSQSLIRITSDPIPEFYPQISPDGKRMVFHTRDDNKTDSKERFSIMMMNLGQPGRTPLVGSYTSMPSFFADSKTIVYCYMKPAKPIIAKSSVDGASGISYIATSHLGDFDSNPCVSPDGKKVIFSTQFGGVTQIATIEMNGMNTTILCEGARPIFHPSGNKFIYTKRVGKFGQIFEYDFKTGQSNQLTNGEYENADASYSKDGTFITFSSTRDDNNEQIFIMKSDGSQITQLTQGNSKNGMPTFAANNDIYFCSNAGSTLTKFQTGSGWYSSDIWKLTPSLTNK